MSLTYIYDLQSLSPNLGSLRTNNSSPNNPFKMSATNAELASSYAALILADDGVDVTVSEISRHTIHRANFPPTATNVTTKVIVEGIEGGAKK